jgi:hypothetical protein
MLDWFGKLKALDLGYNSLGTLFRDKKGCGKLENGVKFGEQRRYFFGREKI